MIKRLVALILVLILSIESFAAMVSDNDGAAFITKAEFDSLKNNFQSELDKYNASIDNKIDGTIASYLAGIRIEKQTSINALVDNYELIQWIPNWKLYGRYKHWSNESTISDQKAEVWFTPPTERRLALRDVNFLLYDNCYGAFANWINSFTIRLLELDGKLVNARGAYVAWNGYEQVPPVGVIGQVWDDTYKTYKIYDVLGEWWHTVFEVNYEIFVNSHKTVDMDLEGYNFNGHAVDNYAPYVEVLTPSTNEILAYKWYWTRQGWSGDNHYGTSRITIDEANFPTIYVYKSTYSSAGSNDDGYNDTNKGGCAWAESAGITLDKSKWFANGVTWAQILSTTTTAQKNLLVYGMFGKANNQDYNILSWANNQKSGGRCIDFSKTDMYSNVKGKITEFVTVNPRRRLKETTTSVYDVNIPVTIRCPLFPVDKIKNLTSCKYIYQKNPLKLGEGLPIVDYIANDGYLQIQFDYDVRYALNTTSYKSTKDLSISFKKGDYLTSDNINDYYTGYVGLVDPNSTTESSKIFNDYTYPNRNGHVDVTIPVKKDETVWFRMCPKDETGGYYAKMSNLKVTMFTQ